MLNPLPGRPAPRNPHGYSQPAPEDSIAAVWRLWNRQRSAGDRREKPSNMYRPLIRLDVAGGHLVFVGSEGG